MLIGFAFGGKEIARIQIGIAQKFESVAVQRVGAAFGHHVHDAAGIVAKFGVEVVGQHAEFGKRIEIGNDAGAAVHLFLHVGTVHQKSVGIFALAADGLVPGVQAAGRGDRHVTPDITIESGVCVDMGTMPG